MKPIRHFLSALPLLCAAFIATAPAQAEEIIIGTGGVTGVYYPLGRAICTAVNKRTFEHGISCRAITTGGSVDNVEKLHGSDIHFAIVQSDVQFYAINGYGPFRAVGPDKDLRAIMSFYPESFTVVARKDSDIRQLDDLKGKRVNIGNPGSGQRTSMDLLMHFKGWSQDDFAETWELTSEEQGKAMCKGLIDAYVYTVGHPNQSIKETAGLCDVVLVESFDKSVKTLIRRYPYFGPVRIPSDTYKGTGSSTATFGTMATLVTLAETENKLVHEVVLSIFEDFIDFRFAHPAFFNLKPEQMVTSKQFAPIHLGALGYFERMGYAPSVDKVSAPR